MTARQTRLSKTGFRPQFGKQQDRVFFQQKNSDKEADNLELRSISLSGNEERTHYSSTWATEYCVSPDSNRIAFIERFHVYVAPFVQSGRSIKVGPNGKGLPTQRVSSEAGDFIHFSGDSDTIHWSLGAELFSKDLTEPDADLDQQAIGFSAKHAKPSGKKAIVNARILTMATEGVIESGTVLIDGNRIVAVGKSEQVQIPEDAYVYDAKGQVVGPGFIDTHAHGSQAANGMTPKQNWVDYARLAFGVYDHS